MCLAFHRKPAKLKARKQTVPWVVLILSIHIQTSSLGDSFTLHFSYLFFCQHRSLNFKPECLIIHYIFDKVLMHTEDWSSYVSEIIGSNSSLGWIPDCCRGVKTSVLKHASSGSPPRCRTICPNFPHSFRRSIAFGGLLFLKFMLMYVCLCVYITCVWVPVEVRRGCSWS